MGVSKSKLNETRQFARENWKIITVIASVVAIVIITVIVLLVVLLGGGSHPTPTSTNTFNGPANINGDPQNSTTVFSFPQFLNNPSSDFTSFASLVFTHDAGYICCVTKNTQTPSSETLLFYFTNKDGSIQGPQKIDLTFLPPNYFVCNGSFAPIFNVIGEVYYFFCCVGLESEFGNFSKNIILFSLDTSKTDNIWVKSSFRSTSNILLESLSNDQGVQTKALKIPVNGFEYDFRVPYIGSFGNNIQVILDRTSSLVKHSLYVSCTEYSAAFPGGSVFWIALQDNSVSPQVSVITQVQDAKLKQLALDYAVTPCMVAGNPVFPPTKDIGTYMNSFGSSFFVTSNQGSQNVLVVGNVTSEDYCALLNSQQPPSPMGYVQGFTYDSIGSLPWLQDKGGENAYKYRYTPIGDNQITSGFGYSVAWLNNNVVVGLSTQTGSTNGPQFPVYNWSEFPVINDVLVRKSTIYPQTTLVPFSQSNTYPAATVTPPLNTLRYNMNIETTQDSDNILLSTWFRGSGNVVSIQNPNPDYSTFGAVQNLGESYSSDTTSSPLKSRFGFAQSTSTWVSRTGFSVRLAVNDPNYVDPVSKKVGRFIVFSKSLI